MNDTSTTKKYRANVFLKWIISAGPILVILTIGTILRFTNLNWDSFLAFHPDERNIAWAVTRIHFFDRMNPKFFAYGGLPIYLYRALGDLMSLATRDLRWVTDWGAIAVIGRYVSATLSTVSIFLIYLVGRSYFSRAVGLASAVLLAFAPWAVREAHFATTETMLVFFLLLLLLLSRRLYAAGSVDNFEMPAEGARVPHSGARDRAARKISSATTAAGFVWGLALAAKTTSLLFGVIHLTAIWITIFEKKMPKRQFVQSLLLPRIGQTLKLILVTALIFFLFSPYTLLDLRDFRESMSYESGVALGRFTVPYTLQFLNTAPYLYQIQTMLWQAGPAAIVGIAGLVCMVTMLFYYTMRGGVPFRSTIMALAKKTLWRNEDLDLDGARTTAYRLAHARLILFLIFPLLYFGWVGTWFAKFSRYNVPFLPFVTIATAWVCITLLKRSRVAGLAFTTLLLSYTALWGVMNWTLYLRPQTRVEASAWIYDHIPAGSRIYTEHWNDGLPVSLADGLAHPGYQRDLLHVYDEPDDEKKLENLTAKLAAGDYVILSTPRIWRIMPGLKKRYPIASRLYGALLTGKLGYADVVRFSSYPALFGMMIPDDRAEETIQVFDHPTVMIFQNMKHLSAREIKERVIGP